MVFDYLQHFDLQCLYQNIGMGQAILVEVDYSYIELKWQVVIHNKNSQGYYPIIEPQLHPQFKSQEWSDDFRFGHAYQDKETLFKLLRHCTRLNNMKAFL